MGGSLPRTYPYSESYCAFYFLTSITPSVDECKLSNHLFTSPCLDFSLHPAIPSQKNYKISYVFLAREEKRQKTNPSQHTIMVCWLKIFLSVLTIHTSKSHLETRRYPFYLTCKLDCFPIFSPRTRSHASFCPTHLSPRRDF